MQRFEAYFLFVFPPSFQIKHACEDKSEYEDHVQTKTTVLCTLTSRVNDKSHMRSCFARRQIK